MDGRLDEAIGLAASGQTHLEEFRFSGLGLFFFWMAGGSGARAQMHLGARSSLEALEPEIPADTWELGAPLRCLVQAHLGQEQEVSEILNASVVKRPAVGSEEDATPIPHDSLHLEAAVLSRHRQAAKLLLSRLDVPGLYTSGILLPTCVSRLLGEAAALLGEYDEARKHYDEAVKICTEMPFRPELALTRLELAELLLEHYPTEKRAAKEHLDFAIGEFREMKMQPSLERALRHKEILKA
jgi:tetratricopeptide (TPR) repeat protein